MPTVVAEPAVTPLATAVVAASSVSPTDEIVREVARRMLAAALEAEVTAFIPAHADQLDEDGHRVLVRAVDLTS
jgi:ribosomal protein S12